MTDLTLRQIKRAVLEGLKDVAEQFAQYPRPTDGTVYAALAAASRSPARKNKTRRKPAAGRRLVLPVKLVPPE